MARVSEKIGAILGKIGAILGKIVVCYRPPVIEQLEFTLPGAQDESPAKVVIKTNPLYAGTSSKHHRGQQASGCTENDSSHLNREVFYGQRKKIRKTKEQEMINAIADLTNHSE